MAGQVMLAASVVCAAAGAALLVGPVPGARSAQAVIARTRRSGAGRSGAVLLLVTVGVTGWAVSSAGTGTGLVVVLVAAASALAAARMAASSRRVDEAARRRRAVVDFCEALVGELRAGQPVLGALERSVPVWPEAGSVLAAARLDGDLAGELRLLSRSPGAECLAHLAAAWDLCAATGGGLSAAAGQVLESARADAAALRQVEGEVSSARATARLVAGLPLVVLSAGEGLGARPWAFLLGTAPGVACLAAGLALVLAGLTWIERIAVAAASGDG
jgi:tight adherence protein B